MTQRSGGTKAALNAFKAATSSELRSLCGRGHSQKEAVGLMLARLCGDSPSSLLTMESPEVIELSKHARISEEDALRAIVVQREVTRLREAGHDTVSALATLTNALTATQSQSLEGSPTYPTPSEAMEAKVQGEDPASIPSPPVNTPAPKRTSKRPRRSASTEEGNDGDTDKKEIARQIQALTNEINEAMRGGDRAKVALLMRQRDQIRTGVKRPRSAGTSTNEGKTHTESEGGTASKRARHQAHP